MYRQLLSVLALVALAYSSEIDNHLVGDPVVDCQDTMVRFGRFVCTQ